MKLHDLFEASFKPVTGKTYVLRTDKSDNKLGEYSGLKVYVEKGPRGHGIDEQYRVSTGPGYADVDWINTDLFDGSIEVPYDDSLIYKDKDMYESVEIPEASDSNALKEMLKRYGFSRIGHGRHADVFCKPGDNYVIKVNTPPIDIAYLSYIKYVESKNNKNPHLPRFSKVRWYGKGKDKFFMIPIEKLEPMPTDEVANLIHTWLGYYTQDKELTPELQKQITPYENLTKTIIDIDENLVGGGIILDLNTENFMLRGKTIVLTDPVADMNSR